MQTDGPRCGCMHLGARTSAPPSAAPGPSQLDAPSPPPALPPPWPARPACCVVGAPPAAQRGALSEAGALRCPQGPPARGHRSAAGTRRRRRGPPRRGPRDRLGQVCRCGWAGALLAWVPLPKSPISPCRCLLYGFTRKCVILDWVHAVVREYGLPCLCLGVALTRTSLSGIVHGRISRKSPRKWALRARIRAVFRPILAADLCFGVPPAPLDWVESSKSDSVAKIVARNAEHPTLGQSERGPLERPPWDRAKAFPSWRLLRWLRMGGDGLDAGMLWVARDASIGRCTSHGLPRLQNRSAARAPPPMHAPERPWQRIGHAHKCVQGRVRRPGFRCACAVWVGLPVDVPSDALRLCLGRRRPTCVGCQCDGRTRGSSGEEIARGCRYRRVEPRRSATTCC